MKAEDSYFSAVFAQYETRSSEDEALMENFRNVVWRQLIPVEYVGSHSPGLEMNKNSLGADVFEHEAARFVPVRFEHTHSLLWRSLLQYVYAAY